MKITKGVELEILGKLKSIGWKENSKGILTNPNYKISIDLTYYPIVVVKEDGVENKSFHMLQGAWPAIKEANLVHQ